MDARAALSELARVARDGQEARDLLRDFLEAWWEFEGEDDALDRAASQAMSYFGDVISLAEGAVSSGQTGEER